MLRARSTGQGCLLDVAEIDAAVAWQAESLGGTPGEASAVRMDLSASVRYQYYATKDDRVVIFQASERKFWRNFCDAIGRPELFEANPGARVGDHAAGNEALRAELAKIFRTRTRAEWVQFFLDHDVAGAPVYDARELPDDPQVRARGLLIEQHHPVAGPLRLFGTPLQMEGERFEAAPAPAAGEHTDEILTRVLGLGAQEIARLRASGIAG
jgi:crotonobetainyl-CoA:carnitine CoA-transferase CaiB-like acyl-CoA transferase